MASNSNSDQRHQHHQKWVEWLSEMDKNVKHDVCLYQMKALHEKKLKNPRAHPDQDGLGKLDMLTTFVYCYDGGVIGAGGQFEVIEHIPYADGIEMGDIDEVDAKTLEQKDIAMMNRIDEIISEKGEIRFGIYEKQCYSSPCYYLISTNHNEDPEYYTKSEKHMYDDRSVETYYRIRYGISSESYYVLSGMSEWQELADISIDSPSPDEPDIIDRIRYVQEHIQGMDLDNLQCEIKKMQNSENNVMKFCKKHNLSQIEFEYISKGDL
jgi:hypothetical protein